MKLRSSRLWAMIGVLALSLLQSVSAEAQYDSIIRDVLGGVLRGAQNGVGPGGGPYGAPPPTRSYRTPRENFVNGPSYDCRRASIAATHAICGNEELSRLDREMADAYVAALSRSADARALRTAQLTWRARRDSCGADFGCLQQAMTARTAELRGGLPFGADAGFAANPAGPDAGFPPPTVPGAGGPAGLTAAANPVEGLLHPPAGFARQPIELFEGRPILDGGPGTRPLFQLIALGMDPGILDQRSRQRTPLQEGFNGRVPDGADDHDEARDYAAQFLDRSSPLQSLTGPDEFVSEQKRRQFLTQYGPILSALAPRAPFEFAYVVRTSLPRYDDRRGGFAFEQIDGLNALNPGDLHGVSFAIPFDFPRTFWPIKPDAAAAEAARLRGEQDGYGREVRMVAVLKAASADPEAMRLDLQLVKMAIYNRALTRELYRFDAPTPDGAAGGPAPFSPQAGAATGAPAPGGDPFQRAVPANSRTLASLLMAARPDLYRTDSSAEFLLVVDTPAKTRACDAILRPQSSREEPPYLLEARRHRDAVVAEAARQGTRRLILVKESFPIAPERGVQVPAYVVDGLKSSNVPPNNTSAAIVNDRLAIEKRDYNAGCWSSEAAFLQVMDRSAHERLPDRLGARFSPQVIVTGPDLPAVRLTAKQENGLSQRGMNVELQRVIDVRASTDGVFGTTIAARLVNPETSAVLVNFSPALFKTDTEPGAGPAATIPVEATRVTAALAHLHYRPELISRDYLERTTPILIEREQMSFKTVSNPFAGNGPRREHVFSPQEVVEGSPAFLTPGLTPKVKAYLERLAAGANLTLWSGGENLLPSSASPNLYDHQRQRMVFNGGKPVSLLPPPDDYHYGVNLRGQSGGSPGPIGPDELEQRAAYNFTYGANAKFSQPASPPSTVEATLPEFGDLPGGDVGTIALDRVIELADLPLAPSRADEALQDLGRDIHLGITARVFYTITGATADSRGRPVLLARLEGVTIYGPHREEFAKYPADRFPRALDIWRERNEVVTRAREEEAKAEDSRPVVERDRAGVVKLNAAAIDLFAASTVGEGLSREALAHILARRFALEHDSAYRGRRFFDEKKRGLSGQEADAMGRDFIGWAMANTPPLPVEVTTSSPIEVRNGEGASWGSLACFSGTYASLMNAVNAAMGLNSNRFDCERKNSGLTGDDLRRCAGLEAAYRVSDYVKSFGPPCRVVAASLPFSDPLTLDIRFSHDLPVPQREYLGGKATLNAKVRLRLDAIDLTNTPPTGVDALPDEVSKAVGRSASPPAPGEYLTFSASFIEASYLDQSGNAPPTTLGPENGSDLASIVRDYRRAVAEIDKKAAPPAGAYGPDIVGVRLGMSFAEAEAVVRQHMTVGRVLQGVRAFDPAASAGAIKPLTSGMLFVSADGLETIALIDEPPAAPEKVLAAWRRVSIVPGTMLPAEVFAKLQAKYGTVKNSFLATGSIQQWPTPRGERCSGLYQAGRSALLSETWSDNGGLAFPQNIGTQPPKGPPIPDPLLDPLADRNTMWDECGPFVTAYYLETTQGAGPMDTIDTILTDIGPYRAAFAASRKSLQEAAASAPPKPVALFHGAYGPDMVGVRLGMSFADAETAIAQHMKIGRIFRRGAADDAGLPDAPPHLPGTGVLYVSAANDEMIGLLDAPPGAPGQVAAAWRRVYSPLAVDFDLVTRRSVEKYGSPAFRDDGGRMMAWGAVLPACAAGDAQAFDTRTTLDARWLDDKGAPFDFRAVNGEANPTAPLIAAFGAPAVPGHPCGPRVRLQLHEDQGDPPANVTETTLTDPGLQIRILEASQAAAPRASAVKF